jgi:hypothetical protein
MGDPNGGFFDALRSWFEDFVEGGLDEIGGKIEDLLVEILENIPEEDGGEEMTA